MGMVIREGDYFYGRTVIMAARVASEADSDEVLVTDAVAESAASEDAVMFEASRDVELKGLPGRHRVHRGGWRLTFRRRGERFRHPGRRWCANSRHQGMDPTRSRENPRESWEGERDHGGNGSS